jgi:hypothetical protein
MRENPTVARAVVQQAGEKKKMMRKKTEQNQSADDPLSPVLLLPLDEANRWCLALKSTMETFASNVREVQSLAREASRDASSNHNEDLARLAQDLQTRLQVASTEMEEAKSAAAKLYDSSFIPLSRDASPKSGEDSAPSGTVPGSIPANPLSAKSAKV